MGIIFRERMLMKNLLGICLLFALISCGNDAVKKEKTALPEAKKIDKINFFMETSGSMAGYLKGATDFVKTIPNLLVGIEHKVDSGKLTLHNYYIADSITAFPGSTEDFINALATKAPAKEKSSEMDKIFKMIADKTDSNDISIFVSDCILSYPDSDIKQNKEINREKAEGGLKPFITSAFSNLQKKNNICASVYGFNSSFYGTYYTYQNTKLELKGNVVRPYYVWVIGNKELLKHFNTELKKLEIFKPDNVAMDFGIFDKPVSAYNVFFKFEKTGEWALTNEELTGVSITKTKPATIAVGVDLSSLPFYAKDTTYLRKNLKLNNDNIDYKIKSILLPQNVDRNNLKKNELDAYEKATHIIVFEISNIYKAKANIQFTLPLQYDTSYRSVSIMDDRNAADISGKTFAFQHLVDGVRAAYQNPNEDFINITIPIKN